jgi:hypothetical protein
VLPVDLVTARTATLDQIIGGLTNTINTVEKKSRLKK